MKTFFIAFSLISGLSYAQIRIASTTVGSGNDMTIDVTINDFTGTTSFEVSGPSSKWFAAAFNTTNMNGYAIVHNNNGGDPDEYTMNGNGAPTLQVTQNLDNITSSTSGTVKTFEYTRDNNTGNTDDYTFTTTTPSLNIAYAIGSGVNLAYHGPNRGSAVLTFTNPCAASVSDVLPNLSVCPGETVEVFGNQVSAGTYMDTTWSSIGCDSIIHTQTVVASPYEETTIDTTLCMGDSYDFMGTEITTGGEYRDTSGCDITILNISFPNIEAEAIFNAGSLQTSLPFHVTQWFDCDGDSIITSETSSSFTPALPGNYAVISSTNWSGGTDGCADTSDCVLVTAEDLGLNPLLMNDVTVTVNNKQVTINHTFTSDVYISVLNIIGQEIIAPTQNTSLNLSQQPNAVYIIKVRTEDKTGLFKISL